MITYISILLIAAAFSVCADVSSQTDTTKVNLLEYFEKKCLSKKDNENQQVNAMNMYGCAVMFNEIKHFEDHYTYFCENEINYQCVDIIVKYYLYCLSPEEQYLSEFFQSSYNASVSHLCKKGKEYFVDTVKNIANLECIKNGQIDRTTIKCLNGLYTEDDFNNDLSLTESIVCGNMPELQTCIIEDLKLHCKSTSMVNAVNDALLPYFDWCKINYI